MVVAADRPAGDQPPTATAVAAAVPPATKRNLRPVFEILGTWTTFITALAFYFGVVRTNTLVGYFGVDGGVLGLSSRDYVLRSADALFVPLGILAMVALAALCVHAVAGGWLRHGTHEELLRGLASAVLPVGLALLALGVWSMFHALPDRVPFLLPPISFGLGILVSFYCLALRFRLGFDPDGRHEQRALSTAMVVLVGFLVGLSVFWGMKLYAEAVGRGRAEEIAAQLPRRAGVVLFSKDRLDLAGDGVEEATIGDASSRFHFRYSGLRLLLYTNRRFLLVPESWSPTRGSVFLLTEDDSVRLQFNRGAA